MNHCSYKPANGGDRLDWVMKLGLLLCVLIGTNGGEKENDGGKPWKLFGGVDGGAIWVVFG